MPRERTNGSTLLLLRFGPMAADGLFEAGPAPSVRVGYSQDGVLRQSEPGAMLRRDRDSPRRQVTLL
jgi:hypothetical protein